MKTRITFLLIAVMFFALLAGCTGEPPATTPQPKGGTLYIRINPEIAINYDADGNVTAVTAVTEDAKSIVDSYQNYIGKDCAEVVSELVTKAGEAGYLSKEEKDVTITITFEKESGVPSEGFVEELEQQIQTVVTNNHWQGTVTVEEPTPIPTSGVSNAPTTQPTTAPTAASTTEPTTEPANRPATAPTTSPVTAPTTEPVTEPTNPGNVPENSQLQEDGTYLLAEDVDLNYNTVDSGSAPYYIRTTIYSAAGSPIRQELVVAETGALHAQSTWEYDTQGLCVSYTYIQYFSTGLVRDHYREEYDAANHLIQKTNFDKDGNLSTILSYSYYDNGNLKSEEETNADGITLSKKEYYESGILFSNSTFFSDGTVQSLTTYREDGVKSLITTWQEDGTMRYYEEFYPNGTCKLWKRWRSTGVMDQEYTSFHDGNTDNGIHTAYDSQGNLLSRHTTGNPDGSPDTGEMWEADGTHILNVFADGNVVEERYTYPEGGFLTVTYDYEADTMHAVRQRFGDSHDIVSRLSDGGFIEGYFESTTNGIYTRTEYRDGYMYKFIEDGATNHAGYAYRGTTYYYPNGQAQSAERYFYADGGRTYYEFDESGNEIYSEDTTNCNE